MIDVSALKKYTFKEALGVSLNVTDETDKKIATLVPIGNWALSDSDLLNSFAAWRQLFMRFFLTQFIASKESTHGYLENLSIRQSDRIFFAIYVGDILVGHIGLSHITANKAELDNIIRGVSGGHKDLMFFAEKTLLEWAFSSLNLTSVEAQVMSKNYMALSLHERVGFQLKERHSLKKVISDKSVVYEVCDTKAATEKFFLDIIEVTEEGFTKAFRAS
jgi:RimJ/RimL family protein N-acetyltransferase